MKLVVIAVILAIINLCIVLMVDMRRCYVAGERHGLNKSVKVLKFHDKVFRNQIKAIADADRTIKAQHDTIVLLQRKLSVRDATK